MARKMNSFKLAPQTRGQAAGKRQGMPMTAALYLAQLRPQALKVSPRPRRQIAVQMEEPTRRPSVVKIIHHD